LCSGKTNTQHKEVAQDDHVYSCTSNSINLSANKRLRACNTLTGWRGDGWSIRTASANAKRCHRAAVLNKDGSVEKGAKSGDAHISLAPSEKNRFSFSLSDKGEYQSLTNTICDSIANLDCISSDLTECLLLFIVVSRRSCQEQFCRICG
jgi:hypothetical protein